jgi:predicted enzyme related to lactoylglutathione lyase
MEATMAKLDQADPSTVAWVDLQTPDLDKARTFYGELLGWSFAGGDDPKTGFYTMAVIGGRSIAGMSKLGPQSSFPPAWSVYFATENADEIARKVSEAGGKIVVAPMDIMDQGRMGFFADPTGAHFGVWQGRQHQGAQIVDEPGAMTWHEVYTRDLPKARAFYTRVFGLEAKRLDAPGIDYWTLQQGPKTVCGSMQMTEQFPPEVPSHWNTYFAVTDVDASTQKAVALGGKQVAPPFDTPYGRMSVVADPFGAEFCIIQPLAPMH